MGSSSREGRCACVFLRKKLEMKILHIGNIKTGIDTYVRTTVDAASEEFDFVVVNGEDDKAAPYTRHGKEVKTYNIAMRRSLNPFRDLKALWQAYGIIKKENPDIVHCHSAKGGVIGRYAAFFAHKKSVYTPHAFSFLSSSSRLKSAIYVLLERLAKLNSCLLACSDSEKALGMSRIGYKESNSFAWCNAIKDIPDYISVPQVKSPYICAVGRPCYQKNTSFMFEAFKKLKQKHPEVSLYLVGAGYHSPSLAELKEQIKSAGLEDSFFIKPYLPRTEALGYVKGCEFFLSTSLYEGLPISVLEAMALGKAVVASNVTGNSDCVENGVNGLLLPLNADVFANMMSGLLADKEKIINFGFASRSAFVARFLIDARIKELESIYRTILKP